MIGTCGVLVHSALFCTLFVALAVVNYFCPFTYIMAAGGVGLTIKKHPRLSNPLPNILKNMFNRLPTKAIFLLGGDG
jgi:hypothetical protein